jgi:hypothetical protein
VHLYTLLDVYNRQKHTDASDAAEPFLLELCDAMPAVDDTPTATPTAVDSDVREFVTFGNTELLPATIVPFTAFTGVTLDKLLVEELLRFVTLAMFVTGGGDTTELLTLNTWG